VVEQNESCSVASASIVVAAFRSAAPLRGRQRPHVPRRGVEGTYPGTLPAARKRRTSIRLHGEAGNDTVLTKLRSSRYGTVAEPATPGSSDPLAESILFARLSRPTTSHYFSSNSKTLDNLKPRTRCGAKCRARPKAAEPWICSTQCERPARRSSCVPGPRHSKGRQTPPDSNVRTKVKYAPKERLTGSGLSPQAGRIVDVFQSWEKLDGKGRAVCVSERLFEHGVCAPGDVLKQFCMLVLESE